MESIGLIACFYYKNHIYNLKKKFKFNNSYIIILELITALKAIGKSSMDCQINSENKKKEIHTINYFKSIDNN